MDFKFSNPQILESSNPHLIGSSIKALLGTAQWGWNIEASQAFAQLDLWLASGQRGVDAATNYPINRISADFRASEKILLSYLAAHGLGDLQVTMKIGSLDNMKGPEVNLSPSFIRMIGEEYRRLFGSNLACLMFHWDNRSDAASIAASVEALRRTCDDLGLQAGLSGVAHPDVYAAVLATFEDQAFDVQLKHNLFHSDVPRYAPLHDKGHRFWAYGIQGGGAKLDNTYAASSTFAQRGLNPDRVADTLAQLKALLPTWNSNPNRPPLDNMAQLGLLYALYEPTLHGILIGASSAEQLSHTLAAAQMVRDYDYGDVYRALAGARGIN